MPLPSFLPSFGVDAACPLPFTFFWLVLLGFHLLVVFSALHCVVLRSSFPLWVCCFPVLSLVGAAFLRLLGVVSLSSCVTRNKINSDNVTKLHEVKLNQTRNNVFKKRKEVESFAFFGVGAVFPLFYRSFCVVLLSPSPVRVVLLSLLHSFGVLQFSFSPRAWWRCLLRSSSGWCCFPLLSFCETLPSLWGVLLSRLPSFGWCCQPPLPWGGVVVSFSEFEYNLDDVTTFTYSKSNQIRIKYSKYK